VILTVITLGFHRRQTGIFSLIQQTGKNDVEKSDVDEDLRELADATGVESSGVFPAPTSIFDTTCAATVTQAPRSSAAIGSTGALQRAVTANRRLAVLFGGRLNCEMTC